MKKIISTLVMLVLISSVCNAQTGIITTIAGNGTAGYDGDGGPATAAMLNGPTGVCSDAIGNIYVADQYNHRIRKISSSGVITTIAGNGTASFSGDGGPATAASLRYPQGVAIDPVGDLYIADWGNGRIRKISSSGFITTVAGGDTVGIAGDGGPATAAYISGPAALAFDPLGNMYIAEEDQYVVRKVNTSGIISTFAGDYIQYYNGDGGPATDARLYSPTSVALDASGNVYIADWYGWRVRKVNSSGIINDVAGLEGGTGCSCTSGPATNVPMNPQSVAIDEFGNMYISTVYSYATNLIFKVNALGIASVYAGGGTYFTDNIPATSAAIANAAGISIDRFGNLYAAMDNENKVRKISTTPNYISDSFSVYIGNSCTGVQFQVVTSKYSSGQHVKTYFGNGSFFDTLTTLYGGKGVVNFFEPFSFSGTYSVKHVLYDGITAVDSITYSHSVSLCQNLAIGIYNDIAGTCNYDSSIDHLMSLSTLVEVDSNSIPVDTISATSGLFYTAYGSSGGIYSFKGIAIPGGIFAACPSAGAISDTLFTDPKTTKYIGYHCSGATGYDMTESASMVAGRHMASGTILVNNTYCTPVSPTLTLKFSTKYIFESSYPAPSSIVGNTVTWNLGPASFNLASSLIDFTLSIPDPSVHSTWLTPGDTVNSKIIVTPYTGDIDTLNNIIIRNDTIKSSYDPNYMGTNPGGYILANSTEQYAIRFENTGNDTAHNIYVMDTLSDHVDPHTLNIIAASAIMNISMLNNGGHTIVKFDFPGINLPDSSHHNQCDGMVIFNIKTKDGLPDGTAIFNHAGIFFDDNPVVMTDTVENIISLITGPDSVCVGANTTSSELALGGIWTSGSPAIATVGSSSGVVYGVAAGIVSISYTVPNQFGVVTTTRALTVNVLPVAGIITGTDSVCVGAGITLTETVPGGLWSATNGNASVLGDMVTGIFTGTDSIKYSNTNTCGTATTSKLINIITLPIAGSITGADNVCPAATIALSDSIPGGTWSAGNSNATVVSGVVTGAIAGTDSIYYTVTNMCGSMACARLIIINPLPYAGLIMGDSSACAGTSLALAEDSAGGFWSSGNTAIATVDPAGFITTASAGIDTIEYVVINSCGTAIASKTVTVNPLPPAITGSTSICQGSVAALSDAMTGGIWSSSTTWAATVDAMSGEVTGVSVGTTIISYTLPTGCMTGTFFTVNPTPAIITGTTDICLGDLIALSDITTGGNWSCSDTTIAFVNVASGVVSGISEGMPNITYILPTGCYAVATVTINACPTGVQPLSNNNMTQIYPNPAHSELTIISADRITEVSIDNLLGQVVFSQHYDENEVRINLTSIRAGIYLIKINGERNIVRVVKQ